MTMHLYVITTTPAHDGSRLCIFQDYGTYRVARITPDGLMTRLPGPPLTTLDEAYTHLVGAIRARAQAHVTTTQEVSQEP
jgi:hypothetical protein